MHRIWLAVAAASGFISVTLGAFGAHALKAQLSAADLEIWQTAVQYQMYHSLLLLAVALLGQGLGRRIRHWLGVLLTVGILLFSGSLYLLVLADIRVLGAITPIGGTTLLAAWALLLIAALKHRRHR